MEPLIHFAFAVLLALPAGQASEIRFEAYPMELKTNLTESASMRCSAADSSSVDVQHISAIFILKNDGEDVASVTPFAPAMALTDIGNLNVKGAITGLKGGEGYIELSWQDPSLMSLGDYQCTVTALDAKGHTVQLTSHLRLTTVTPSIMDVISEMKSKDKKQQTLIDDQKRRIDQQQQQITSQAQTITHQSEEITHLQACTGARVAFTAAFGGTGRRTVAASQVVTFPKVITNEGGSFNSKTGLFTCITEGLYLFNLHLLSDNKNDACLQLQRNNIPVTSAFGYDDVYNSAASTSASLHLQVGDVVRVVATCTSEFYQRGNVHQVTSFDGILIRSC